MRTGAKKYKRLPTTVEAKEAETSDYYIVDGCGIWVNQGEYIITEPNGTEYVMAPSVFADSFLPIGENSPDCASIVRTIPDMLNKLNERIDALQKEIDGLKKVKKKLL